MWVGMCFYLNANVQYLKNGGDLSDLADREMEDWPTEKMEQVNGGPRS
jgi:hypothetical protein